MVLTRLLASASRRQVVRCDMLPPARYMHQGLRTPLAPSTARTNHRVGFGAAQAEHTTQCLHAGPVLSLGAGHFTLRLQRCARRRLPPIQRPLASRLQRSRMCAAPPPDNPLPADFLWRARPPPGGAVRTPCGLRPCERAPAARARLWVESVRVPMPSGRTQTCRDALQTSGWRSEVDRCVLLPTPPAVCFCESAAAPPMSIRCMLALAIVRASAPSRHSLSRWLGTAATLATDSKTAPTDITAPAKARARRVAAFAAGGTRRQLHRLCVSRTLERVGPVFSALGAAAPWAQPDRRHTWPQGESRACSEAAVVAAARA